MHDFKTSYRTHTCGELREKDIDKEVKLVGWVRSIRDLGNIVFVVLADRYGLTQLVFQDDALKKFESAEIKREHVIQIIGTVREREPEMYEPIPTGKIEVVVKDFKLVSRSEMPPFELIEEKKRFLPKTDIRYKYRYLDLRRHEALKKIEITSKFLSIVSRILWQKGFLYVPTPYLIKSTPEGAKDFIVLSSKLKGHYFSLPQSPQIYKQLLMIGSLDRYFQFAKCFRDEDLRADRQPEFTQLDIEMSFVSKEEIMKIVEEVISETFKEVEGITPQFETVKYSEAITIYGSDKPDLRRREKIYDLSDVFKKTGYKIFERILKTGGKIYGIFFPKTISSKQAKGFIDFIQEQGGKGMTWLLYSKESKEFYSIPKSIVESFSSEEITKLKEIFKPHTDGTLYIIADKKDRALKFMGSLRKKIIDELFDVKEYDSEHSFVWVIDAPLFTIEDGKFTYKHHPFTLPKTTDFDDLLDIETESYDLVIDGIEVGGGSLRVYDPDLQIRIFKYLGYKEEEIMQNFGHLINALKFGPPPHGGIALGIERIGMILSKAEKISEVVAFPKSYRSYSPIDDSPMKIDEKIKKEYGLIESEEDELKDLLDSF